MLRMFFPEIIEENGYVPGYVFNMDETGLFWKRMPSRTFLFKDELQKTGIKAYKDPVTLLMCGNAAGFMLKPGLIYKSPLHHFPQPLRPLLQLLLHRLRRHPRSSKALHAPVQSLIVIASSYCTGLFINFA